MAKSSQNIIETEEQSTVEIEPKGNIINPVRAKNSRKLEQHKDLWIERKLPPLPGSLGANISLATAEQWFDLVKEDEARDRIYVYVYRVWPVVIRGKNQKNLCKYPLRLWSFNTLTKDWGGGRYKLLVNDAQDGVELFHCFCEVDSSIYEPNINFDELDLRAIDNKGYIEALKTRGILDKEGKLMNAQVTQAPGATVITQDQSKVFEMVSSIMKDVMAMQREKASNNNPNEDAVKALLLEKLKQESPNSLATMLTAMKELMPKQEPVKQDDTLVKMLIEQGNSLREQNNQLMMKIIENNNKPAISNDPLESITKTLEVMKALRKNLGDAEEKEESVMDKVINVGVPVVGNIIEGIMSKFMLQPSTIPTQAIQQSTPTPKANPKVITMSSQRETMNQSQTNQPVTDESGIDPNLIAAINSYGGLIIQKLNDDVKGYEFATMIIDMFSKGMWAGIANYGQETIFKAMQAVPQFWSQVAPFGEQAVKQWIEEFINYEHYLETEEESVEETKGDVIQ